MLSRKQRIKILVDIYTLVIRHREALYDMTDDELKAACRTKPERMFVRWLRTRRTPIGRLLNCGAIERFAASYGIPELFKTAIVYRRIRSKR